jgi:methionine-rich copper-binding protein CopC
LLKRFNTLTVVVAILVVPALAFSAANKFQPGEATVENNTVTIPLVIANQDGLMAADIPLTFSDGVTLKEVTFENTRVEYFDLKLANINNEDNQVLIGLVHQASATAKPTLDAGAGAVANLVFEIDDPTIDAITIDKFVMEVPHHHLMFIYNTRSNPETRAHDMVEPEFTSVTVALSGAGSSLPIEFALAQNYPNPFNPSTEIAFSLPSASQVELSVFNVLGQKVVTLLDEQMAAGEHTVTWDGRNSDGSSVSSGVYFYRIAANSFVDTKKMMMLK